MIILIYAILRNAVAPGDILCLIKAIMIRPAQSEDVLAIAEIHVASWKGAYSGQLPDDYLAGLSVLNREHAWRESLKSIQIQFWSRLIPNSSSQRPILLTERVPTYIYVVTRSVSSMDV